jgi:hypothetical protein
MARVVGSPCGVVMRSIVACLWCMVLLLVVFPLFGGPLVAVWQPGQLVGLAGWLLGLIEVRVLWEHPARNKEHGSNSTEAT